MPDAEKAAENILRGIAGGLASIAPLAPVPWRIALSSIGALAELTAGMIAHGVDAIEAIEVMRSALPDYRAAKTRLEKLIEERSK